MTEGMKTIIYPVRDLAAAKALYGGLLGAEPMVDEAYYVGYQVGEQHVGLVPWDQSGEDPAAVAYWHVPDIKQRIAEMVEGGARVREDAKQVGGGRQVASVIDPDGNIVGLVQDS